MHDEAEVEDQRRRAMHPSRPMARAPHDSRTHAPGSQSDPNHIRSGHATPASGAELRSPGPAFRAFWKTFVIGYGIRAILGITRLVLAALRRAVVERRAVSLRDLLLRSLKVLLGSAAIRTGAWLGSTAGLYLLLSGLLERLRGRHDGWGAALAAGSASLCVLIERGVHPARGSWGLSLYALVRAAEFVVRALNHRGLVPRVPGFATLLFAASCARIMYDWFYYPQHLSPMYARWITVMADMDSRLLQALRGLKAGTVGYGRPSSLLHSYAVDHGLHPWTCDPQYGFLSCRIVHPSRSCTSNAALRLGRGVLASAAMYLPVYLLPIIIFRRAKLAQAPLPTLARVLANTGRSSLFLGLFISTIWASICAMRQRLRDDSVAGPMLGCALCGLWVVLERPARRLELALYVLPRALESVWRKQRVRGHVSVVPFGDVGMLALAAAAIMYCYEAEPSSVRPALWRAINTYFGWI